jgi:hypothetical protein
LFLVLLLAFVNLVLVVATEANRQEGEEDDDDDDEIRKAQAVFLAWERCDAHIITIATLILMMGCAWSDGFVVVCGVAALRVTHPVQQRFSV